MKVVDLCRPRLRAFQTFLKRLLAKALNFASTEVEEIEPGDSSKKRKFVTFGDEAVQQQFDKCSTSEDIVDGPDLKFFRTYRWVLTDVQKTKFDEWERHSVSTAKDRLTAVRNAAIKDVEDETKGDKKKRKDSRPSTSSSAVAPPLQQKKERRESGE